MEIRKLINFSEYLGLFSMRIVFIYIYIYYRVIVSVFPIGLDFLFITFFLNFFLSWTSSLSISSFSISASTLSNHVLLGLPTGLLFSTLYFIHNYDYQFIVRFPRGLCSVHSVSYPSSVVVCLVIPMEGKGWLQFSVGTLQS